MSGLSWHGLRPWRWEPVENPCPGTSLPALELGTGLHGQEMEPGWIPVQGQGGEQGVKPGAGGSTAGRKLYKNKPSGVLCYISPFSPDSVCSAGLHQNCLLPPCLSKHGEIPSSELLLWQDREEPISPSHPRGAETSQGSPCFSAVQGAELRDALGSLMGELHVLQQPE